MFSCRERSKAYEELKEKGVEFIAEPFEEPTDGGGWCTTFKDLEGNILQLFGQK